MSLISHVAPSYNVRGGTTQFRLKFSRGFPATNNVQKMDSLNFSSSELFTRVAHSMYNDASVIYRRRCQVIVAASPPTEDVVSSTEPLTKEDLVQYLASGCKPKDKWRYYSLIVNKIIQLSLALIGKSA